MTSTAVFEEQPDGTYDLMLNGRVQDYGIAKDSLGDAVRRARLPKGTVLYTQDKSGYRSKMGR